MPAALFPRGGKTERPSESESPSRPQTTSNSSDFLFGSSSTGDDGSRLKRKRNDQKPGAIVDSAISVQDHWGGGNVQHFPGTTKPPTISALGWKHLSKNFKLLGHVKEHVSDDLALVSIQNMLTAYVRRKDASQPPLTASLPLNAVTSFVIVALSREDKRIELSPSAPLVNRGVRHDQLCKGESLYAS